MGWVSRKEYCEHEGIKIRAFKYRKKTGLIQWRYGSSGRGGEAGKRIEVWIDDSNADCGLRIAESKPNTKDRPTDAKALAGRYRLKRGEPGCHVVTPIVNGMPLDSSNDVNLRAKDGDFVKLSGNTLQKTPPSASGSEEPLVRRETTSLANPLGREPTPDGGAISNLPVPLFSKEGRISPRSLRIANLRFAFIQAFHEELTKEYPETLPLFTNRNNGHSKTKAIQKFLDLYNSGLLLPDIHAELKQIKRSTLYNWLLAATPDDLMPRYGGAGQSKITEHEKNLVLTLLLHQNRLKIAYAITLAKEYLAKKQISSPSSPATLRRFADQFKKEHYDLWVLHREGEKALNDKVLPYAERDWHLLEVGEGLVADGHRLNFQVIHPITGKPCRAVLVLFWDWRSSYPLGWEIMIEENIQCVASALRNSILTLGKTPKWVLLDNGKAFRAKIFTEDISFEDTELPGMFARLNINYHFAQPYNAQAKPIERIFEILNEQLERLVPSYTGASINDKPAYTKRNEKYAQSLHNPSVPTIQETHDLICAWRDRYAERPSRGRDGFRPIDILRQAQDDPAQGFGKIDPNELIYLMMDREIKNVHRNGVTWLGWHWYDENLYGLKDKVVIRYSLSDLSQIYVFHKELPNGFVVARPVEKMHPMASESENPKNMEAVKDVIRLKNKAKNMTHKLCDLLDSKAAGQIDWSRTKTQEISETIQKIEEIKNPKVVNISPFANSPEPEMPLEEEQNKCPFDPPEAWARYEFHLKGGAYKGAEMDQQFMEDFRSGKIAPGLWESLYAESEKEVKHERKVCHY